MGSFGQAHRRSTGFQIQRLDHLAGVFPFGENQNVAFLRPLVAARQIFLGNGRP
jgi:hypothetical protein